MTSVAGHARPSLSKPADQITLLDIYKAVEGDKPLLHLDISYQSRLWRWHLTFSYLLQGFYNEIQKLLKKNEYDYFTGYHKYLLSRTSMQK